MSDTITQECTRCGDETDCIEGLCQECVLELQEEMRHMDEPEPDGFQESENMPKAVKTDLF